MSTTNILAIIINIILIPQRKKGLNHTGICGEFNVKVLDAVFFFSNISIQIPITISLGNKYGYTFKKVYLIMYLSLNKLIVSTTIVFDYWST